MACRYTIERLSHVWLRHRAHSPQLLTRYTTPVIYLLLGRLLLAVPPLIPLIHGDLRMFETEVGILAGLPVALFAAAAIPGSLLVARLGAAGAVTAGLVITGFGSVCAVPPSTCRYAFTIITGFGVAVMQPAMPRLVRVAAGAPSASARQSTRTGCCSVRSFR